MSLPRAPLQRLGKPFPLFTLHVHLWKRPQACTKGDKTGPERRFGAASGNGPGTRFWLFIWIKIPIPALPTSSHWVSYLSGSVQQGFLVRPKSPQSAFGMNNCQNNPVWPQPPAVEIFVQIERLEPAW